MNKHNRRFPTALLPLGLIVLSLPANLRAEQLELAVSPAPEPTPALRYRLLPISSELVPGDAAPVYLRLRHQLADGSWKQVEEKHEAWNSLSIDKLPVAEARKFVNEWSTKVKHLRIAARRQYCDWSYPLIEQKQEMIEILLPDCQDMRQWARLLQLQARVEIAEHAFDQAIDTMQTGIALGRHVGHGPFLINNLVGIAICTVMLERVEEMIAQPGAPSLYWALTALPRPLVSMREALELDLRVGENMVPELNMTDEPHSRAEWSVLLEKLYDRLRHVAEKETGDPQTNAKLRAQLNRDLTAFVRDELASSRNYLSSVGHLDAQQVRKMSDAEVVGRALVGRYREMRDDQFKLSYLPWREAKPRFDEAERKLKAVPPGPLTVLAGFQPTITNCLKVQMQLERRVAILRVLEAIRLYAAAHQGSLPEDLQQITEVPVPDDPATGKPLEFHRDGQAMVLALPEASMPGRPMISYRITLRK